jgi:hypothetical protein
MFGVSAFAADAAVGTSALDVLPPGSNVVGVGFGAKVTLGAGVHDGPVVRVYVRAKLSEAALPDAEVVPRDVNGTPTDVIAVGDVAALVRPTSCGVPVGHRAITAGTLGCLVTSRGLGTGDHFILSNNHVLANSNAASSGDAILEPGPLDGGSPTDPIAELTDFEPIDFSGPNSMDAAIARVLVYRDTDMRCTVVEWCLMRRAE